MINYDYKEIHRNKKNSNISLALRISESTIEFTIELSIHRNQFKQ
jgi:hypothetical protein